MPDSVKDLIFKKSVNVNRKDIIKKVKKLDVVVGKNSNGEYVDYIRLLDVLEMLGDDYEEI